MADSEIAIFSGRITAMRRLHGIALAGSRHRARLPIDQPSNHEGGFAPETASDASSGVQEETLDQLREINSQLKGSARCSAPAKSG